MNGKSQRREIESFDKPKGSTSQGKGQLSQEQ